MDKLYFKSNNNSAQLSDFNFCSLPKYKRMHRNKVLYLRIIQIILQLAAPIGTMKTDDGVLEECMHTKYNLIPYIKYPTILLSLFCFSSSLHTNLKNC